MNLVMQAAMAGLAQQDEANALIRLRDRLASRGVNAELRDNNTALMVHRPEPGLPVWVFVGYGGAYYSWQSAEQRHPVDDVEGAANVLAEYIAK
ncbi:hypothetical protein HTZ77_32170 [Nonomuraea sp. SMC257]|uniref:Uncharacterized protein n=1 Tax=Nonomuraea montanisoli TaxID=2741721 RepID=A0A7Y6IDB2_9ACTN|nr:hypothetical protein [Nonomuraea montanisoli]NUW36041.1 hypothetical protein [Nonomuraea montanisoli]